jgi:hypothetical protein
MKRFPELYMKEFHTHLEKFKARLVEYKANPAKKCDEINNYMLFFSHVIAVFSYVIDFICIQGFTRRVYFIRNA